MDFEKDSLEWTQELLGRSKHMPLNIGCCTAACRPKHLDLVLDLAPQCRTFCLKVKGFTEGFLNAIQKPAPHLEVFGVYPHWKGEAGVTTLPKILFNGEAPKLRKVHFNCCRFDITTAAFSQLTCLEVSWAHGFAGPTVSEWLNLLNNIPRLKKLLISMSISRTLPSTVPLPRAQLPHLSDLSLSSPLAECSSFLRHIDIPPLERLSLTTYRLHFNPDSEFIVRFLEERMDGWAHNMVNCECLASIEPHSLWLRCSNHDPINPDILVTFDWEGSQDVPEQTTAPMICFSLPEVFFPIFRGVRSLQMHSSYLLDEYDPPSDSESTSIKILGLWILRFFHNLVILHLVGYLHLILFPHLEQQFYESSAKEVQDVILPSLQALEFSACDFKMDDGRRLKVLRAFLGLRARAGKPIKTISFKYYDLGEGYQTIGEEFGVDISS
ncbi:uncharacterized protein LACBIDRAFT_321554 [Laccaria bicolor S238N-H82]|uniref:Predicted protein n=1 Tax=Laccaria bicolor (strain S238N-H82 / ATCC MYA-4686) TaxID=486041 RepID=B0CTC5_LACBS|nr:uncharacterized protein LACBIDRAFT_321554 [Laccaria bicolor S238N-H82]EDR13892.1 predicted protein [Laccaria bicolor S238N-H82]|eukprot:XP_001874451.1 predicted protein [Laccaria bicolor S238N-H82]